MIFKTSSLNNHKLYGAYCVTVREKNLEPVPYSTEYEFSWNYYIKEFEVKV